MRRRDLLVLLGSVVVAAVIIGAAVLWVRDDVPVATPPPPTGTTGSLYAYVTPQEFAVVDGDRVVARVSVDNAVQRPQWTVDGRFAFTTSGAYLVAIDRQSTGSTSVVCDCRSAVPIGRSEVAWVATDGLHRVDLTVGEPKLDPRPVPKPPDGAFHPTAVGSSGERVYLAQELIASALIDSDHFYSLEPDGSVVDIDPDTTTVLAARAGPGGLAFHLHARLDYCASFESVVLVRPDGGRTAFSMKGVGGDTPTPRTVRDVWWTQDGVLRATTGTWTCPFPTTSTDDQSEVDLKGPTTLWELRGERWEQVSAEPVLATRELAGGLRAVLRWDRSLEVERDGKRTHVADHVFAIEVAP